MQPQQPQQPQLFSQQQQQQIANQQQQQNINQQQQFTGALLQPGTVALNAPPNQNTSGGSNIRSNYQPGLHSAAAATHQQPPTQQQTPQQHRMINPNNPAQRQHVINRPPPLTQPIPNNFPLSLTGMQGMQTAGMQGMQTAGMQGMQTAGMQGMQTAGMQGMQTAGMQGMQTAGMQGMQTAGMQGMQTAGMQGMQTAGMQGMQTAGMQGMQTAGMQGMQTAGMQGMQTAGMQGMQTAGMQGMQTAGMQGMQTGQANSLNSRLRQAYPGAAGGLTGGMGGGQGGVNSQIMRDPASGQSVIVRSTVNNTGVPSAGAVNAVRAPGPYGTGFANAGQLGQQVKPQSVAHVATNGNVGAGMTPLMVRESSADTSTGSNAGSTVSVGKLGAVSLQQQQRLSMQYMAMQQQNAGNVAGGMSNMAVGTQHVIEGQKQLLSGVWGGQVLNSARPTLMSAQRPVQHHLGMQRTDGMPVAVNPGLVASMNNLPSSGITIAGQAVQGIAGGMYTAGMQSAGGPGGLVGLSSAGGMLVQGGYHQNVHRPMTPMGTPVPLPQNVNQPMLGLSGTHDTTGVPVGVNVQNQQQKVQPFSNFVRNKDSGSGPTSWTFLTPLGSGGMKKPSYAVPVESLPVALSVDKSAAGAMSQWGEGRLGSGSDAMGEDMGESKYDDDELDGLVSSTIPLNQQSSTGGAAAATSEGKVTYLYTECSLKGFIGINATGAVTPTVGTVYGTARVSALIELFRGMTEVEVNSVWNEQSWRLPETYFSASSNFAETTNEGAREVWVRRYLEPANMTDILCVRMFSSEYHAVPADFETNARRVNEATTSLSYLGLLKAQGFRRHRASSTYVKSNVYHGRAGAPDAIIATLLRYFKDRKLTQETFPGVVFVEIKSRVKDDRLLGKAARRLKDVAAQVESLVTLMKL